jgi:hypothetical protein
LKLRTIRPRNEFTHRYDAEGKYLGMDLRVDSDDFSLIQGFSPRINNFVYPGEDGRDHKITNCQTLFEAPAPVGAALIKELAAEYRRKLREIAEMETDEKNSE